MRNYDIDPYQQFLERKCRCGHKYTIRQYLELSPHYFGRPWNYRAGCADHCLSCWLGVGPDDLPSETVYTPQDVTDIPTASAETLLNKTPNIGYEPDGWPYVKVYESLMEGDILTAFQ